MLKMQGLIFFKLGDAHKVMRKLPIMLRKVQLQTLYLIHLTNNIRT